MTNQEAHFDKFAENCHVHKNVALQYPTTLKFYHTKQTTVRTCWAKYRSSIRVKTDMVNGTVPRLRLVTLHTIVVHIPLSMLGGTQVCMYICVCMHVCTAYV